MKTLLQIHTSLNGTDSLSSSLADEYSARWRQDHPTGRVIVRDLAATPVPHLSAGTFAAFTSDADSRSRAQTAALMDSDELIGELQTDYLRQFLAFVGIDDVQFVYAEGTAMGEAST